MLSFEDVPQQACTGNKRGGLLLADADDALAHMNAHYYVQPYKPIAGNPLKVVIKKVIRKLTKFYVEPVVFEQNEFNANTVSVLNTFRGAIEGQASKEDSGLADRIEALELAQKALLTRLDGLERENAALRSALEEQEES